MTFEEYKEKALKDPEIKKAYEDLQPEYEVISAMIDARNKLHISQKDLANRTGISQAHISRLESGKYNPSVSLLKRLAKGLNKQLHIEFR